MRVDFVISNAGHHLQSVMPVVTELMGRADGRHAFQVVSLCELRGIPTPVSGIPDGVATLPLFPAKVRSSPATGRQTGRAWQKYAREAARRIVGRLYLQGRIRRWLEERPDVVVLQNDSAFPYELIVEALHARKIPFVLAQEGIRFPLPGESDGMRYGANGAARIAAWGRASGEYFSEAGAPVETIELTGCPRFDRIATEDWRPLVETVRASIGLEGKFVTLLTNPVDDQGFCTTKEKTTLVARFAREAVPVLSEMGAALILKLHGREDVDDYREALEKESLSRVVHIIEGVDLYPLIAASSAAITMASTVGLEALQFGVPLGVVRMPRNGFVHDFVSSGAALGLEPGSLRQNIHELLDPSEALRKRMDAYIDRQLACRSGSAGRVAHAVLEVA